MATADDWNGWFDRHGPALLLLARQWVPAVADAEDVVQEAFARFWRSRHRAAEPSAYLYACVKRAALEWLRGRQRRARREERAARPEAVGDAPFFAGTHGSERGRQIEAALAGLPEGQREVLVLKTWGGLTFQQIGAALGLSANTAASRYRYALDKLRACLAEEAVP
jgi:RNA polymerase sigma-70 factor (ECF subfamily)